MRILFACFFLLQIVGELYSQQTELEFIPASENYFPYINSYSPTAGLQQFYLVDSKWVKNEAIPSFDDASKFRDVSLQYINAAKDSAPQLFVYSKSTGDFAFYFLTYQGWTLNANIPSGKIKMNSRKITAEFSHSTAGTTSYIFAYAENGAKIELLEIVDNSWSQSKYFPEKLY